VKDDRSELTQSRSLYGDIGPHAMRRDSPGNVATLFQYAALLDQVRARPLLVGTPGKSKTMRFLCIFSQLGEFVPGISLNGGICLKVRRGFGIFALAERQLSRDVLYVWGYNPVWDDQSDFTQSRPLYGDTDPHVLRGCIPRICAS